MLIKQGFVVAAIDAYFNGDRVFHGPRGKTEKDSYGQEMSLFKLHLWQGRTLWGMMVRDEQCLLDYLETRPDIDHNRIGYYGFSWGGPLGAIFPAVENRLKVSVLPGAGFFLEKTLPEVDQINFAPRVTIPVLMINGNSDRWHPVETSLDPMFKLLGTSKENKRLAIYEGGHLIPRIYLIKETLDWLDRYLGPVKRKEQ